MSLKKLSAAHRKRIAEGTRRSWTGGKRRARRTKVAMRADKLQNPWETFERREEYRANEERIKARAAVEGGMIWSLSDHRYVNVADIGRAHPGIAHPDPSS